MTEKFVEFISEGVNDPGIFKAVFLAGGPGSGKSFMVGKTALTTFGLRPINSDDTFEAALRKANMIPTPENIYSERGQSLRSRAKKLTQTKLSLSVIGRLGLVIDGTGKDVTRIQQQATTLKNLGYDVAMIFVNTDLETALERNRARPRTLPDNVVKNMWQAVQNNIGSFQRMFKNNLIIVDNSKDSNSEAQIMRAYRDVLHFVRQPVMNHKAREWISNQKKQAMREDAVEQLELLEKLKPSDSMGDYIKDFYKSDAPQFKGKSKKKRRQMAIAAKLATQDEEANPRIPRKKGQPANSKKHSDLYTDENPKGTIHGLKFATVKDAKASVAKIKSSGRSHAHKIQAAVAMEQRAREMGKSQEAAVYRKYIDQMKKKTEKMNEDKKYKVAQDPDIKDRKSSQPAHYHKGLKKSTKIKRDAQFQRQAKMRDDDASAYKFAPGDKDKGGKLKKTKPSKYTKYVDNMLKKEDSLDEKCWDSHKQVGMKKKGKRMVPNCVPKNEETDENRDSMTLPKIGKMRNVSKRVSKQRTKHRVFDKIKIGEEIALTEVSMSDKIKAKTIYKDKYKEFAKLVLDALRKDKSMHGGKLRHGKYYHAGEILRKYREGKKLNSRILGDLVSEEYKYERGTPEGTRYMQAMTPGEPGETTKKNKNSSKYHYKVKKVEEDVSNCKYGKYYCSDDKRWKCRQGPKQTREETEQLDEYGYKSPAHARLQKMRDKIRTTAKYKADVKKLGGTPLKPGEKANTFLKTSVNEEDGVKCQDGHYYCRQRKACVPIPEGYKDRGDGFIVREDVLDIIADIKDYYKLDEIAQPNTDVPQFEIGEDDIRDMLKKADNLTIDDMLDLHMIKPEEVVEVEMEVDPHTDVQITEVLTPLGRIKRKQAARRNKTKLKIARMRAMKRAGGNERIKMRATRGARNMMYGRLLRGRDKSSLPPAEKSRLEKMIKRFQPLIARIAIRMVPQMRKVELNRLKSRGSMKSQAAKKFKVAKGGSASKYKAKKFKIKKR